MEQQRIPVPSRTKSLIEDPTRYAVLSQAEAMSSRLFEVGILFQTEEMMLRQWDIPGLAKSIPWLKAKNAADGAAIYIRPAGEQHHLSLIDDLPRDGIARLTAEGFQPCLVIETSPNNFQAWLNHGRILPKELLSTAARSLAQRFGGDFGSADWRHFGRLAGFTNRKPKYEFQVPDAGSAFPFVRIEHAAPNRVYDQAKPFLAALEKGEQRAVASASQSRALTRQRQRQAPVPRPLRPIEEFHADCRYGGDLSRADLAWTIHALGRGMSEAEVRETLIARDMSKKGGERRIADYVERTLEKAAERVKITSRPRRLVDRIRELGR